MKRRVAGALAAVWLLGCTGDEGGGGAAAGAGGADAGAAVTGGGGMTASGGSGAGGMKVLLPCHVGELSCNEGCLAKPGDEHAGCTAVHFAQSSITSMVVDGGTLYFATLSNGIQKLDIATSAVTVVAEGMPHPQTLVLGANDLYYTTSSSTATVSRVAKPGGTPAVLAGGLDSARDLALAGDTLYVLSSGLDPLLRTLPIAGGAATQFGTVSIQSFLIDGATIYYVAETSSINGTLTASPLADPTQTTPLASSVFANRLATDADAVYWITTTDHAGGMTDHVYYRAPKTGTTSESLMQGNLEWEIMHQDGATVYVRERYHFDKPGNLDEQQRLLRMPLAAPSDTAFMTIEHTTIEDVVTDGATVYIAAGQTIVKVPK